VVGLGGPLVAALGGSVPGLRSFPALQHPGGSVPVTQADVWLNVRGDSPGVVFERLRAVMKTMPAGLVFVEDVATFLYRGGRDLTGYEDGTENPKEEAAVAAALVAEGPFAGGSFVAVQRWQHDLGAFEQMSPLARDHSIGRSLAENVELADAPESAHVKRAAQESFSPPSFMLRRSMPWGGAEAQGLYFVAYGADLDRYERVLRRMAGQEDGVVDALFDWSRPLTGGYYWCPPVREGRLDLTGVI